MLRWLSLLFVLTVTLTMTGCSSKSTELPPSKAEQPKMTTQESANKAMQGMPPEMQKKMEAQMQKMRKQ